MWRIGIGLDKFYPGNVYGLYVDIWADTKQVRNIQEVFSTLDPPSDKISSARNPADNINEPLPNTIKSTSSLAVWIPFSLLITIAMGAILILNIKKANAHYAAKRGSFKVATLLICMLVLPTSYISAVSASSFAGCSTIWGSTVAPKTTGELTKQYQICQYINTAFYTNGYDTSNYQGSNTLKANTLSSIEYSEAHYPRVASVWFDHGIGQQLDLGPGHQDEWHFMLCDSNGGHLYDYEIFDKTDLEKQTLHLLVHACQQNWTLHLMDNL